MLNTKNGNERYALSVQLLAVIFSQQFMYPQQVSQFDL